MKAFFSNILYSGLRNNLGPEDRVKILFINSMILFGLVVLWVFGIRDLIKGDLAVGGTTLGVAAVIVGLFFTIRLTRSIQAGTWVLPVLMFGFYTYLTVSSGAGATAVLWMLTYPVIVIFLVGAVWGSVFAGTLLALHAVLFFVPDLSPVAALGLEFKMRILGSYVIIFSFSLAFETIRAKTQGELTRTAWELAAAKVQTDGILTNVSEGIFLLDETLTIADQHSRSLGAVLGLANPGGTRLTDALTGRIGDRDLTAAQDYLEMFFLPDPPWHLMEEINPLSEITLLSPEGAEARVNFTFTAFELASGRRILGTVRDVTQAYELSRQLKAEEDRSARQMRHLFQIIHVKPELLLQFLQDADQEIADVNRRLKDPKSDPATLVEYLFQGVHAVKGNAALVGLVSFANRVHELETFVAEFRGKAPRWQDFLEMTVKLSVTQAELTEVRELMGKMAAFQRDLQSTEAGRDLLLLSLERAVDRLGLDTGLAVDLDTTGFQPAHVPDRHRKLVKDVLVQLVRNSFTHGLEPAHERRSSGKPAKARIRVAAIPRGRELSLAYWDDGRGIDPHRLRQAARNLPRWTGADPQGLSDDQALELVFAPGFTTAPEAGLHGGRGVGLGLVKERVEAAGGRVKLRSVPGRGVAFDITLPMA